MLRQLFENEGDSKDEDDDLNDDDLNEMLARSDKEIEVFQKLDKERLAKEGNGPRLYTDAELPPMYKKEPEPVNEVEDTINLGRGTRERKSTHYDDNLSEYKWAQMNGLLSGDEEDPDADIGDDDDVDEKPKKRKRARKSKAHTPASGVDGDGTDNVKDEDGPAPKRPRQEDPREVNP
ncbi:unnamed protein product [Ambrosiozyma monospora]|uniref:Unnamed protein product n=1 Tax=Ambrosiozyma monospora TaxID=43982 RepID=A0ACB5UCP2_AMBMO|nr:unnamed protein product [Ambrosiozyma monospora]